MNDEFLASSPHGYQETILKAPSKHPFMRYPLTLQVKKLFVHPPTSHNLGVDFDAAASVLADTLLCPETVAVLPNSLNPIKIVIAINGGDTDFL